MDPPAWTSADEFQYSREDETDRARSHPPHRDEELRISQPRMSQREAPAASNAAMQQGAVNDSVDDNNAKGERLTGPDYKDQVRRAGNDMVAHQPAVAQQANSIIPLAESVYIVVEEEEPPNPTLPAVALPAVPSGINAKNTLGTVERPAAKPAASMTKLNNSGNDDNSSTAVPLETPPVVPNTSNVSNSIAPTEAPPPFPPKSSNNRNSLAPESPDGPSKAVVNRQPGVKRKHKVWAGAVVLGVVVVVVVVAVMAVVLNKNEEEFTLPPQTAKTPNKTITPQPDEVTTALPTFLPTVAPAEQPVTLDPTTITEPPTTVVPTQIPALHPMAPTDPPNSININPDAQIKLTASDGAADDWFGWSVAMEGVTIVIGAYLDDTDNGSDSGSAHVYTRSGSVWTEQAKLTASDGDERDSFGFSVAVDGSTIVIGARWDDTENGSDSGSVYVYTFAGTVWTEQAKLTASDGSADDGFGWSVAIDGGTIVIGALMDSTGNGIFSGSAYVFTLSGTVWTEQVKLTASDGAAYEWFGTSVAINGDTIVIGANGDDTENGSDSGSAHVYTRSGSVWTEQAKLTASDGDERDSFGFSVAVDRSTIVIGARWDDTENGSESGSAYVYTFAGTVWTEQAKLTAGDGSADDGFGWSVAVDGNTIVIGAPDDSTDDNNSGSGRTYVYTRSGSAWTEQAKLTASDGAADDGFGISLAMDGGTIVIGADWDDTEIGVNSGSAYIFFE